MNYNELLQRAKSKNIDSYEIIERLAIMVYDGGLCEDTAIFNIAKSYSLFNQYELQEALWR